MEVCFLASGEQLAVLDADKVQGQSAKTVKQSLAAQIGVTRFRQKLFWEDGSEIQNDEVFTSFPLKIQLLVLEFLPPDAEQGRKMMLAAEEDDSVALEKLLKSPRSPDVRDERGCTPLLLAAMRGRLGPTRLLLEAGAELEAQTYVMVPLHAAASRGHLDVARALVEAGAEKDPTTQNGLTPIHFAATHGHLDIVRFLVESGADYHLTARNGSTALDAAIAQEHDEIARYLSELKWWRKISAGLRQCGRRSSEHRMGIRNGCRTRHPKIVWPRRKRRVQTWSRQPTLTHYKKSETATFFRRFTPNTSNSPPVLPWSLN